MVTTLKTKRTTKWTWSGTRFVRESPSEKQTVAPKFTLSFYRARYYDPSTGEFISKDPLEYVDGMSQYRGYFVPSGVDPLGKFLIYGESKIYSEYWEETTLKPWLSVSPRKGCRLDEPLAGVTIEDDTWGWGKSLLLLNSIGPSKFLRKAKSFCCCKDDQIECATYYAHVSRVVGIGVSIDGTLGQIPGVSVDVSGFYIFERVDHHIKLAACADGSWSVEIYSVNKKVNGQGAWLRTWYHDHNGTVSKNRPPSSEYWSKKQVKGPCLDVEEITSRLEIDGFTAPNDPIQ